MRIGRHSRGWNRYPDNQEAVDYLALHLAFYLASWGMYRSFQVLLEKKPGRRT